MAKIDIPSNWTAVPQGSYNSPPPLPPPIPPLPMNVVTIPAHAIPPPLPTPVSQEQTASPSIAVPAANSRAKPGKPRKYHSPELDALDDAAYRVAVRPLHNRDARLKRQNVKAKGENIIILPKSTAAFTPPEFTEDAEAVRLYELYMHSDHTMWLGVESFRKWVDQQGIQTEAYRTAYLSYIRTLQMKQPPK